MPLNRLRAFRLIFMYCFTLFSASICFPVDRKMKALQDTGVVLEMYQSGFDLSEEKLIIGTNESEEKLMCHKQEVEDNHIRAKRYVTNSHKWLFTNLKWRMRDPFGLFRKPGDFAVVRKTLVKGLDMWSLASNGSLVFDDITDKVHNHSSHADLDIFFARWNHGDHEPFDGEGGIVAHSGYPMEGKIHFDASELWTINGPRGIDLRYVTLHELGHALGLRHSRARGAIMNPVYKRDANHDLLLTNDDIEGIRALYPLENF